MTPSDGARRAVAALVVIGLAACTSSDRGSSTSDPPPTATAGAASAADALERETPATSRPAADRISDPTDRPPAGPPREPDGGTPHAPATVPSADAVAAPADGAGAPTPDGVPDPWRVQVSRDDVSSDVLVHQYTAGGHCDPSVVNDHGVVVSMRFVVHGELQEPCHPPHDPSPDPQVPQDAWPATGGAHDPRLVEVWSTFVELVPAHHRADVDLLVGFERCRSCDALAFVRALDDRGEFTALAVDLDAAGRDPGELRFTLVHELAHVITRRVPDQFDPGAAPGGCASPGARSACFAPGSMMADWIGDFWNGEDLGAGATAAPAVDRSIVDRCDADAGFVGAYAATGPEEDFAESFATYVFDVEVGAALDAKLAFFDRRPELRHVRDRVRMLAGGGIDVGREACAGVLSR
ncbi:hypothetical protein [Ilumatobacter sp.]|uniref:hypothetical protein n=1 Tax=Ilumatobacter sp. TaxID=1967498 RepID=UPI003B52F0F1